MICKFGLKPASSLIEEREIMKKPTGLTLYFQDSLLRLHFTEILFIVFKAKIKRLRSFENKIRHSFQAE